MTDEAALWKKVFLSYHEERTKEFRENKRSLAQYTSADAALKIIKSEEIWLRRSSMMNDFSEIQHGENCLRYSLREHREKFETVLKGIAVGSDVRILEQLDELVKKAKTTTFLASFSEHGGNSYENESSYGRLSMWRAYGGKSGIALVFNRTANLDETASTSGAFLSPVVYCTEKDFSQKFGELLQRIQDSQNELKLLRAETFELWVSMAVIHSLLSSKHVGFSEEREWRLIYTPLSGSSSHIRFEIETIGGIPQKVGKFPLRNNKELGLKGIELKELLQEVIVGPTDFSFEISEAILCELRVKGIADCRQKVRESGIPFRRDA
jgi:Protein of unknown function (DUF2971)